MLKWIFGLALLVLIVLTFAHDTRWAAAGAFVLLGAIIYAFVSNRRSANPGEIAAAEQGARALREDVEEHNAAERRDTTHHAP